MKRKYGIEKEGQIDFFDNFRINYKENPVLIDNTDGVWKGNLFEFKTDIKDLNKVLSQAIKYLSRLRVKGENVPANILLISLNTTTLYLYKTEDYFEEIHMIYSGSASRDNDGFVAKSSPLKYDYSLSTDTIAIQEILKSEVFVPIRLDEDCIVGWAERYYNELPKANKGDFLGDDTGKVKVIGEIREPKHFKGLILPYENKTNEKFKYLMDKLNDRLRKKDLGAFYTPIPYCEKAAELLRMAIKRVPEGNDYVILDRCAGTGNLESVLTDEELSHCILSTYEYYEYKVLCERLADKVRFIVPPTESLVEYSNGCVLNADAMSEGYINNPDIKKYIDDPKCTIILYENPPYSDSSAMTFAEDGDISKRAKSNRKESFISKEFTKYNFENNEKKASSREISNLFIWSAFKYYLREETDSYILFSPVKYFKSAGIVKKKMIDGFLFNRKYFHATPSSISCILWTNSSDGSNRRTLKIIDIDKEEKCKYIGDVNIFNCNNTFLPLFDRRTFDNDKRGTIFCDNTGEETNRITHTKNALLNENIIAYVQTLGYSPDPKHRNMVRLTHYDGRGYYIRKDNYKEKIVLWVAKCYSQDEWYNTDVFFNTSDGGDKYTKDTEFLKYCLIYTCLSNQNKCLSFKGSDNRNYQNDLCFDERVLAYKDLQKFKSELGLNTEEIELLSIWDKILTGSKLTKNYDSHWNYGVYQITKELNTSQKIKNIKGKEETVYDYPELNGDLTTLRVKLKEYYKKYITPKMFEYELLK